MVESRGFATVCADGYKRAAIHGKFVLHGSLDSGDYAGAVPELICENRVGYAENLISFGALELGAEDKRRIEELWPLEVGKEAEFVLRHGPRATDEIRVKLRVAGITTVSHSGSDRRVFEIVETRVFRACLGMPRATSANNYQQTMWYDPATGVILKSERVWTGGTTNSGLKQVQALINLRLAKGPAPAA